MVETCQIPRKKTVQHKVGKKIRKQEKNNNKREGGRQPGPRLARGGWHSYVVWHG